MATDDVELARAALATGRVEPLDLLAVRRDAQEMAAAPTDPAAAPAAPAPAARAEVAALLAGATATRLERSPYHPPADRLRAYPSGLRADAGIATLALAGEALDLLIPGAAEPLHLLPVSPDRFETAAGDARLDLAGRAGLIEWAMLNRGGEISRFSALTSAAEPTPPTVASAPVLAVAPRGAAQAWPQFRGPGASGIGDGQGAPSTWDLASGTHVRFRTPLPGLALSSPIVWGDRIYVTTAVSGKGDTSFRPGLYGDGTSVDDVSTHSFRLYALDTTNGQVVWEREVFHGAPPVRRHMKSSLANATPTTDGKRIVVLFGVVGVLAAYDPAGTELWRQDVGILDCNDPQSGSAEWGHASSPLIVGDTVIVQADRRKDSFLAAYDLATGAPRWRVARDEPSTWATPALLRGANGDELVTNGTTIRGYDPKTGALLWTLGPNSEVVVATPVAGEGVVYVTAGYPPVRPVYAVRAGQRGDLSLPAGESKSAAIAWSWPRGGTYIPTPILYRGSFFTINNNGLLTVYRASDGSELLRTRLGASGTSFAASPVAADGRVYFASEGGEVFVIAAEGDFAVLATNQMNEVVMATPAIADGLLVVRTLGHVVGLDQTAAARQAP